LRFQNYLNFNLKSCGQALHPARAILFAIRINIDFSSAGKDFNFMGAQFEPKQSNKQPLNPPHHNLSQAG
jgi:hypothetical protein